MSLIDALQAQHRTLEEASAGLDEALLQEDAEKIRKALERLGTLLNAHLMLEDRDLYPGLKRAAEAKNDSSAASIMSIFTTNMGRISESLGRFLQRHQSEDLDVPKCKREWEGMSLVLRNRIHSEETTLYPMYRKLTQ